MIRPSKSISNVYLCREPVDFRKAINGLAVIVEETLCLDPFSEQLFVFTNKRRDKIKILAWDKTGFILWLKTLDKARFKWPLKDKNSLITLSGEQLNWLLDGYDVFAMKPHKTLHYETVL
ncbi:IS66 family insertion sequence element accessory protein TnpB [Vibrio sp. 1-Bac 57]|uniref:IS66 family insertion sequence element accessory protein TnpB n=1 Tax=Psychromonas arctica TaxID=168275 RepID=UPI000421510F|nr:IS66 family insertion sequence element accessory protein TnpB [Psychromonas arctica]